MGIMELRENCMVYEKTKYRNDNFSKVSEFWRGYYILELCFCILFTFAFYEKHTLFCQQYLYRYLSKEQYAMNH